MAAPTGTAQRQDANDGWKLPPIQRFLVKNGHVEIDDAVRKLNFTGTITSEEKAGGGQRRLPLTGDGTLNEQQVPGRCEWRAAAECG